MASDKSLVEALMSLEDSPPGNACRVGWMIDNQMDDPDLQEAVREAFRRPGVQVSTIVKLLQDAGYKITDKSASHHARGVRGGGSGCRCAAP